MSPGWHPGSTLGGVIAVGLRGCGGCRGRWWVRFSRTACVEAVRLAEVNMEGRLFFGDRVAVGANVGSSALHSMVDDGNDWLTALGTVRPGRSREVCG